MKSRVHIFKINKGIIFTSPDKNESYAIKEYCLKRHIPFCFLDKKVYCKTIKEISENFPVYSSDNISSENTQFLILCGMNGKEVNEFLDTLTNKNISIPLKCCATQYNYTMSISECIKCIREEHFQMHQND